MEKRRSEQINNNGKQINYNFKYNEEKPEKLKKEQKENRQKRSKLKKKQYF